MSIPAFRDDGWLPVGHHDATWEELTERFSGESGSQRATLTKSLLQFRDSLRRFGVSGTLIIDGSYIGAKIAPKDFDALLIAPDDIEDRKEADPDLADLMDAQKSENERGYSFLYVTQSSPMLTFIVTVWDQTKQGVPKGVVEVKL